MSLVLSAAVGTFNRLACDVINNVKFIDAILINKGM